MYLNKRGAFHFVEKPDVILLDINLPKSNGFAVLVEAKSTPELMDIPVIILTSSSCDYDKEFAMKNKADLYMEKPLEFNLLTEFMNKKKSHSRSFLDEFTHNAMVIL